MFSFFLPSFSIANEIETTSRTYGVFLGASRVVFDKNTKTYALNVENRQEYPILIQTTIMDENLEKKLSDYIVTPPLFRLDAGQKNTISIIKVSKPISGKTESMGWVCVKSVPPTEGSAWVSESETKSTSSLNVNILINSCVKLISRPKEIESIKNASYASKLKWSFSGGRLSVHNPTPYFINFKEIIVGGKAVTPPVYIKPKSTHYFDGVNTQKKEKVSWTLIDDYGASTKEYHVFL
ncbi:TPA: fimbria/pilus periplasmic chaperone [Escherichia coli]|nr:fimbria/pilus periplasmic chaperone [Escherichia coli]